MFYTTGVFGIKSVAYTSRLPVKMYNRSRTFTALSYRICGECYFYYEGKTVVSKPGSVTFIPAGIDFIRENSEDEMFVVHLDAYGEELWEEDMQDIIVLDMGQSERIYEMFSRLCEEWNKKQQGYKSRCTALLYQIMEYIEKRASTFGENSYRLIESGMDYMGMHFKDSDLTVAILAKKCNISEVYFRKIFKNLYGTTPIKMITEMRLDHAVQLLESGRYRLHEVAQLCGFNNVKYFSTLFKAKKKISPSELVEKLK